MSDANGSPVTRAELAAHIKGIDEHFDGLEADVVEIRYGISGIVEELRKQRESRMAESWLGPRGRELMTAAIAALVAAAVTLAAAFIH